MVGRDAYIRIRLAVLLLAEETTINIYTNTTPYSQCQLQYRKSPFILLLPGLKGNENGNLV